MTATQPSPADVFMHLIVTFLTPMFLSTTGGDPSQARAAATQVVSRYAASDPDDLLLIAQAVALGLAVISSISLSMAEDIPVNLVLRLRGNAVSLHRAAGQCRQALADPRYEAAVQPDPEIHLPARNTKSAQPRQQAVEHHAEFASAQPEPDPQILDSLEFADSPATMRAALADLEAESRRRIADADVALIATGQPFPQASSHNHPSMRAAALNTTASHLIGGTPPRIAP